MYVCIFVCLYVCYTVVLVPDSPLRSDVTCHPVALRGSPTRDCDTTDFPKVYKDMYLRVTYSLSRRLKLSRRSWAYVAQSTDENSIHIRVSEMNRLLRRSKYKQ